MAGLYSWTGIKRQNIKPQCDRFIFPDGHGVIVLAEGRLLNLGWVQERKGRAGEQYPCGSLTCIWLQQGLKFRILIRQ